MIFYNFLKAMLCLYKCTVMVAVGMMVTKFA